MKKAQPEALSDEQFHETAPVGSWAFFYFSTEQGVEVWKITLYINESELLWSLWRKPFRGSAPDDVALIVLSYRYIKEHITIDTFIKSSVVSRLWKECSFFFLKWSISSETLRKWTLNNNWILFKVACHDYLIKD